MKDLNKNTLAEQIYEILKEDIITRKIQPGEKLTLKSLQERFNVSSTPIRDALTRLTEDNLVTYYSNVGIKVVELTIEDLNELYPFMGDLDSLAIRYSYNSKNRLVLMEDLKENLSALETATSEKKFSDWLYYSDYFHLIFYNNCENSRLCLAASKMRGQITMLSNTYEQFVEYQTIISNDHVAIYNALKDDDLPLSEMLMKEHLKHGLEFAKKVL